MKVFLLRAVAFNKTNDNFNAKCDPYEYKAEVFSSLELAISTGKTTLQDQIKNLYNNYEFRDVCSLKEFTLDCISFIFEVEEIDPNVNDNYTSLDEESIVSNPFKIVWDFNLQGDLLSRNIYVDDNCSYDIRPDDLNANAGTKFKIGDIVKDNKNKENKKLYIITACPSKEIKPFSNYYNVGYICDNGYYDYGVHNHFHEEDIDLYTGEVSEPIKWLSDFFARRIKVDEQTKDDIMNGKYNFSEGLSYRTIK
ncbi:hypothetical protein [Haloplasma contractile]|uniref:Uncharacterized protein n=1 Tax=Haloplasma contractile SSD-17B TaxID=1033810 RepID=F7PT77_9MOLU|nr:hypothetical protein [Haloplasma contractile]ERJ12507.1 hypothetical protein HLPCO_001493 [Haloplasma contractile SSD-17B]